MNIAVCLELMETNEATKGSGCSVPFITVNSPAEERRSKPLRGKCCSHSPNKISIKCALKLEKKSKRIRRLICHDDRTDENFFSSQDGRKDYI